MELTDNELADIYLLSDQKLYPDAIAFIKKHRPLEGHKQMTGLLDNARSFDDLMQFVKHQGGRNWLDKKEYYGAFYQALERYLNDLPGRVTGEFGLVQAKGLTKKEKRRQIGKFKPILAQEFVRHLAAENLWREIKQ